MVNVKVTLLVRRRVFICVPHLIDVYLNRYIGLCIITLFVIRNWFDLKINNHLINFISCLRVSEYSYHYFLLQGKISPYMSFQWGSLMADGAVTPHASSWRRRNFLSYSSVRVRVKRKKNRIQPYNRINSINYDITFSGAFLGQGMLFFCIHL